MKFICPLLVVKDMDCSKRFYQDVLHAKVTVDLGANVTIEDAFALQTEESWLSFTGLAPDKVKTCPNQTELYFEEPDYDGFLHRLESMTEIQYLHAPEEMPWGQRVVRFYDPDDHIIEVGEPMDCVISRMRKQGLSEEQIAKRTGFSVQDLQKFE